MRECKDVDLSTFDQVGRKKLAQFLSEAKDEAIPCIEKETGQAIRFARRAQVFACDFMTGEYWVEAGRGGIDTEPKMAEKDHTISETLKFGEHYLAGGLRGIQQELKIRTTTDQFWMHFRNRRPDRHHSSAYPNITSIVWSYPIFWKDADLSNLLLGGSHLFVDDGVRVLLKKKKMTAANFIHQPKPPSLFK